LGVSSFLAVTLWGVLLIGIMIVQKYQKRQVA